MRDGANSPLFAPDAGVDRKGDSVRRQVGSVGGALETPYYAEDKACLYVKKLDDVHLPTLKKLIRRSVKEKRTWSPTETNASQ